MLKGFKKVKYFQSYNNLKKLQIFFKTNKKEENNPISEEITITHTINYQNDSLENDPNFGLNNEEEEEENEKEEDNKEEKGEEEIIEIKKENPSEKEKENTEKENQNIDDKKEEGKTVKVFYKNANNDKTSFCHVIFHNGFDIDISTKKIFECYEHINRRNLLLFKKSINLKSFIFIEEQYLYILKDININKNNEHLRRINNKLDLNTLFDYKVQKEQDKYLFTFDFIQNNNLFERNMKHLLFEEKEGEKFEELLIDTLEKIEADFLDEIFGQEEENDEEEEEEDGEDSKKNEKDEKDKKDKNENKINENEDKDNDEEEKKEKKDKKAIKKISLEGKDSNVKLSSSRAFLK